MAGGMHAAQKRIPAELSDELTAECRRLAGETFRVLSCHGVSRVDLLIDADTNKVYVNEINTIPGSLSYYLWEAAGLSFENLMECGSLAAAREKGLIRSEGKEYVMKDGDVVHFLFNV